MTTFSRLRSLAIAALLTLVSPLGASAQERSLRFDRITIKEGLSHSVVTCAFQDQVGFMWFGTQGGLTRYDGYGFTAFNHNPEAPESLARNWVWSCLQDRQGNIWVGTDGGGLDLREPNGSGFRHHRHIPSNPESLSDNTVRALLHDSSGRLWVGTEAGLNLYRPETGTFRRFNHNPLNPESLSHDVVRTIAEDRHGRLWVGTYGGGLDRFDPETETFTHYRHDPADPGSLSEDRVRYVYEDSAGAIWVGTYEAGLNRLDPETGTFERFLHDETDPESLSDNRVRWILEDSEGVLWVGTDGGLNEWRPEHRSFLAFRHRPGDLASLGDERVMCLYQDRGGVIWVGTRGGLHKWNPSTGSFAGYRHDPLRANTISSNRVLAFAESPRGTLWVGTYGGLNRIDLASGRVTRYGERRGSRGALQDERIMSLAVDARGDVWVGTYEAGLHRFDPRRETFTNYRHDPDDASSLSANGVTVIYPDSHGSLWVGTYGGGLNRFDYDSGNFVRYRHDPNNPTSLSSDRVLALEEDSLGVLWVGTLGGGLNGFDRDAGTFFHLRADAADPAALASDLVWALHEDTAGALWIGTQDAGLMRWELEARRSHEVEFLRFTRKEGLAADTIYAIEEDGNRSLWLSSDEGLSQLDPATSSVRNFDDTHGLMSREFNFAASHRLADGALLFGGNEGFNLFHPESIRNNSYRPPVVLTSLLVLNREVETEQPLPELSRLELDHGDSVVTLEFAALDFTAPERNEYAYMLEGFDDGWVDQGSHRRVTYTNLDPGRYVLRVRGSNNDGAWAEHDLSLALVVRPPIWRTWYAWTLYLMAGSGLGLVLYRSQRRKLEREAEYTRTLEREVQLRTSELAARNSELESVNKRLRQASVTDSLTGLKNRRYLIGNLELDAALVDVQTTVIDQFDERRKPTPGLLFMLFDLDGFKDVNDTHGHNAGDSILVQVTEILESVVRKTDTVVRWGGDEFVVLGRYADRGAASVLAERIRQRVLEHPFEVGEDEPIYLSCSIGFAYYPFFTAAPAKLSWEQVMTLADRALYIAKNSGRDAWIGITEGSSSTAATAERIAHLSHAEVESLVAEGHLELQSSIGDSDKLVWAWA